MSKNGQQKKSQTPAAGRSPSQVLTAVAACFLLSGFAALLYQAAWLKTLGIVFGTSHVAVATVLSAYMAGLATGAAIAARLVRRIVRPVYVYGVLEAVIGISALLVPLLLVLAQQLLAALYGNQPDPVGSGAFGQNAYYLLVTFLVLAVPTCAMGATLPLLSRYAVTEDAQVGPRIGLLYGINTIGAVFGALVAGFLLLPQLGLIRTLAVGAAVNLIVFGIAVYLSRASAESAHRHDDAEDKAPLHWIMPLMLLSGAVSFTLEVLWSRLLSHVFGGTIYAFTIMLACFLSGIALGGLFAGRFATNREVAARWFVLSQLLVATISFISYSFIDIWLPTGGLGIKAVYAFAIIVPSTLFIGATYPLAVRLTTQNAGQTANASGKVYAWNTIGAIVGALLTGFFVLPLLGFGLTLKTAMITSLMVATLAAWFSNFDSRHLTAVATSLLLATIVFVSPGRPDRLVYANAATVLDEVDLSAERFYGVGRSATILLRERDGFINIASNGLSESSVGRKGKPPFNLSQRWLAGLTTLARPDAENMLIIGYGGGIALEGVPPHVSDIDVIELEPMVITGNAAIAEIRGGDPLQDPRVNLVINDARNAITLTNKRYDAIVSQPSHPWTGGAAHLYTSEFLDLSKAHLNEGGIFLQWINSQFLDEDLLRTLVATLVEKFEHVELYQPERQVLMFLASDSPIELWDGARGAETALRRHTRFYNRMGLRTIEDAIAMMTLDEAGVRKFAEGGVINTDDHNLLAFFSRPIGSGLTADSLLELFADVDPLTDPDSEFHQIAAHQINRHIVADQLLQGNFIQRTFNMARATANSSERATIDALGYEHSGNIDRAEASYELALSENPANEAAQFGLLRLYLPDLAQRQIPQRIGVLANQQTGPVRRVLEGWVFGASGDFERLKSFDAELAQVPPTSLAHPIAVKLRVDWRIVESQRTGDAEIASEAMQILDDILASHWSFDLYVLRSGCAFLAGNAEAFVESINTATRQLEQRVIRNEKDGNQISADEAVYLKGRLDRMRQRLDLPLADTARTRADQVSDDIKALIARL